MGFLPEIFTSEANLCLKVYDGNPGGHSDIKITCIQYYEIIFIKVLKQQHALYTFIENGSYTCTYQGVRNVNFLDNFAYVLNE